MLSSNMISYLVGGQVISQEEKDIKTSEIRDSKIARILKALNPLAYNTHKAYN